MENHMTSKQVCVYDCFITTWSLENFLEGELQDALCLWTLNFMGDAFPKRVYQETEGREDCHYSYAPKLENKATKDFSGQVIVQSFMWQMLSTPKGKQWEQEKEHLLIDLEKFSLGFSNHILRFMFFCLAI